MDMDNPFVYVPLIFVVGITGFVALMAGIYLPIRQVDHHLTVSKCHSFSEASGYQQSSWTSTSSPTTASGKHLTAAGFRPIACMT
jgi:hypothetical protein